jgi:hypothetical protein
LDLFVQACALDILQQLIGMTAEIELNMIVLITLLWPKAKVVMVSKILADVTYFDLKSDHIAIPIADLPCATVWAFVCKHTL